VDFGDFGDAAYVSHNSFVGYDVGLESEPPDYSDYFTILDNRFERCGTAGIRITGASYIEMARDTILACGAGAILSASSPLYYDGSVVADANVILSCPGTIGMSIAAKDAQITSNVVGRCGGDGIAARCSSASGRTSRIAGNTSFLNAGSGYVLTLAPESAPNQVDHNIGYGNGRHGIELAASDSVAFGCNDWFANAAGAVQGVEPSPTDLNLDPDFCGLASDDVHLASDSPVADAAGCGRIGALGVGCATTPAQSRRFTKGRVSEGSRVAREDAAIGTARGGNAAVGIGLLNAAGPVRREFRLTEVGPNPGSGPVRIGFALARAAEIEVGVYDLLGRRVTSLASGSWPAGSHELQWSGRAPAGLYVLRYQYPGGTDKRAIVRVQ
jgi:parallel beta helix pectate lyase-like protein